MVNYWNYALGLSVSLHLAVLTSQLPLNLLNNSASIPSKKIAVTQIEIVPETIEKIVEKKEKVFRHKVATPPPSYDETIMKKLLAKNAKIPFLNKPQIVEERIKKVTFSQVPSSEDLKEVPGYMDYYCTIREKISRNAYHYYDSFEKGEIFLSFVIHNDGNLEAIYVKRDSSRSEHLRQIALESIKQAAPFSSFPRELANYPSLQFNIAIYFKNYP